MAWSSNENVKLGNMETSQKKRRQCRLVNAISKSKANFAWTNINFREGERLFAGVNKANLKVFDRFGTINETGHELHYAIISQYFMIC
jgi:hypothetical protein